MNGSSGVDKIGGWFRRNEIIAQGESSAGAVPFKMHSLRLCLNFNVRGCVLHTRLTSGSWQSHANFDRNVISSNSTLHCLIEQLNCCKIQNSLDRRFVGAPTRLWHPKKTLNRQSFLPSCCCHTIPSIMNILLIISRLHVQTMYVLCCLSKNSRSPPDDTVKSNPLLRSLSPETKKT